MVRRSYFENLPRHTIFSHKVSDMLSLSSTACPSPFCVCLTDCSPVCLPHFPAIHSHHHHHSLYIEENKGKRKLKTKDEKSNQCNERHASLRHEIVSWIDYTSSSSSHTIFFLFFLPPFLLPRLSFLSSFCRGRGGKSRKIVFSSAMQS